MHSPALEVFVASTFFLLFIKHCDGLGLPVRFLREVANSSYTIAEGSATQVIPWINRMTFTSQDLASAARASQGAADGLIAVTNFYHESTHAWIDLYDDRPELRALIEHGARHYLNAPLVEGRTVDDPDRVFQEAMAEYVANRAANYWNACNRLAFLGSALRSKDKLQPRGRAVGLAAAREVRTAYDRLQAQGTFGYQNQGWFQAESQKPVLRPMTDRMKEFADREILERKIPYSFLAAPRLVRLWDQLRKDVYPDLEG